MDIGLIRDEANEAAQNRGLRIDVQPLGENLVDMVAQSQGADHAASEPTDTIPIKYAPGTNEASSAHRDLEDVKKY